MAAKPQRPIHAHQHGARLAKPSKESAGRMMGSSSPTTLKRERSPPVLFYTSTTPPSRKRSPTFWPASCRRSLWARAASVKALYAAAGMESGWPGRTYFKGSLMCNPHGQQDLRCGLCSADPISEDQGARDEERGIVERVVLQRHNAS